MGTPRAACRDADPELFFAEVGGHYLDAKMICSECPLTQECLQYALDNNEKHGVWGGLTEEERRRLVRHGSPTIHRSTTVTCQGCGDEFEITTFYGPPRKYCDRNCRARAYNRAARERQLEAAS